MPATANGGFAETFDESPLPELDSEALDCRVASESFLKRGKLGKANGRPCDCWCSGGANWCRPSGGLLLFGKDPEARSPDAWVQCGRFRGSTKVELTDAVECHGRLPQALEETA